MPSGGYELLKPLDPEPVKKTRSRRYRLVPAVVLLSLSAYFLYDFGLSHFSDRSRVASSGVHAEGDALGQCAASTVPPATLPAPVNPWAPLSAAEIVQVQNWLFAPEQGLNLTRSNLTVFSDNHLYAMDSYAPPKDAVLRYLASPSMFNIPPRFARATVNHGGVKEPYVQEYLVGPLPIGPKTTLSPLRDIYHIDPIPFNARGFDDDELTTRESLDIFVTPIAEALKEIVGGVMLGRAGEVAFAAEGGPFTYDGSFRRMWLQWYRDGAGSYLYPINLYQYMDCSGTDRGQWKQLKIVYNHQIFNTSEEFLAALRDGSLERSPVPARPVDLAFSSRKHTGPRLDLDHLPGPRSVSFAGLRFRVDREQKYISWMGWGMFLGFDRDVGLTLWDIRFRGNRIIYELSPQEAMSQYAGNDPFQATTSWFDRYFGMGHAVRDMLPGYDCPHEAVYFPATTFGSKGIWSRDRAICVFEHDSERPLTRHLGYDKDEFGATKGYQLVVRSITTVAKYFDYIFHLDGTVEVRVSASGYLQAGYWDPSQAPYGTRIYNNSMGSLHDHVMNFKVDLDVVGTANSLLKTTTKQEVVMQPWFDDDWGQEVVQQRIYREYITNEDDALLKYPHNFEGGYAIVNQDEKNKWGTVRGYAIHPGYSPIYQTVLGSKRQQNNANWARYNLAVSRRKETEPASSSVWNSNLPLRPPVDFNKFFDGENITQEDLVAWVNIGMHHLTQAEDAPNTRTNTATASFFLTPLNYFDRDVSIDSINSVLLQKPNKTGDPFLVEDYGVRPVNCVPKAPQPFEYAPPKAFNTMGEEAGFQSMDAMKSATDGSHRMSVGEL